MNHCLKFPVIEYSKHDTLQQISHITPLQVREKKADISTVQFSLNKDVMKMWEKQGNKDMAAVEIKENQQKALTLTCQG